MQIQGQQTFEQTPEQLWAALLDPQVLQRCIAGCEKLEPTGEDEYQSTVKVSIGPVSARFVSKLTLSDVQPPRQCTLKFSGQGGVAGFGKGQTSMVLQPQEQGGTRLDWVVDAQVGGKLAQIGSRLVEGSVRMMSEDFFTRLRGVLQAQHAPTAAQGAEALGAGAGLDAPDSAQPAPRTGMDPRAVGMWAAALALSVLALAMAAGWGR